MKLETKREIEEVVDEAFVEYSTVGAKSRLDRVEISPSSKKISLSMKSLLDSVGLVERMSYPLGKMLTLLLKLIRGVDGVYVEVRSSGFWVVDAGRNACGLICSV